MVEDPNAAHASGLRRALRRFYPTAAGFTSRDGLLTLLVFLAAVVGFVAICIPIELALGDQLASPHPLGPGASSTDAVWHLATAFVLVLPVRRRVAIWLAPFLALGLDIDHIYGSYLPTVIGRPAHALLFAVVVALVLFALRGRPAALLGVGAVVAHVAVDGGSFPFLVPITPAFYPLPFSAEVLLVVVAALLFFTAFQPLSALRSPKVLTAFATAVGIVVAADYFLLPMLPGIFSI
jgi:hypothetical protein